MNDYETQSRLLAKLVRDVLRSESFETLADLSDAVKCRCAKLKIPYPAQAISEAFAMVSSNRPLLADPFKGLLRVQSGKLIIEESKDLPRHEAAAEWLRLVREVEKRAREQQASAPAVQPERPELFPDLVEAGRRERAAS